MQKKEGNNTSFTTYQCESMKSICPCLIADALQRFCVWKEGVETRKETQKREGIVVVGDQN